MTRNLELTIEQICTVKLALIGWGARCAAEAERMDKWAIEYDDSGDSESAAKCRSNAASSRQLKAAADATLAVIR